MARRGTKFFQPQAQFLQIKAGPLEPVVQEARAQCLHLTCSVSKSALGSSVQNVTEFIGLKIKGVEKNYKQMIQQFFELQSEAEEINYEAFIT